MKAKKIVAALLAAVLLIGVGVGGTLAWLYDFTNEVENTFTVGNINIDLQETVNGESKSAKEGLVKNDQFTIIPGTTQPKDPKVIVEENSEDCYVFVKVIEKNTYYNGVQYVNWGIHSGWKLLLTDALDGGKVYYRVYSANTADQEYPVLDGNKVTYSENLTKQQIDALQTHINNDYVEPSDGLPSLTFKAYAVQMNYSNSEGTTVEFTPEQAWNVANGLNPGVTTP